MNFKAPSLNIRELRYWIHEIANEITGAQLQGVSYYQDFLVFDFYAAQAWQLVFVLSKSHPWVGLVLAQKSNFWGHKKTTPIQQYLNSHFKNQRLDLLALADSGDRQLDLNFSVGQIRATLIPHLFNIELSHLHRKIYLFKPQYFMPRMTNEALFEIREGLSFSPNYLLSLIDSTQNLSRPLISAQNSIHQRQIADLEAKQLQRQKIELSIQSASDSKDIAQLQKELAHLSKKILRLQQLIAAPSELTVQVTKSINAQKTLWAKSMQVTEAKGRMGEILGMVYVIGASGEDSLKLIRQAKAWHWWFHQRQGSGPHLILACEKNKSLSHETLKKVAERLVEYINKNKKMPGRYEMIATQIRFVRPIKGAKAGLVSYQNIITWQIDYPLV